MKLEGEYLFNGPRDDVWKLIRDPDVLATALPGTQSLTRLSDTEFEGAMNLHIGPVTGVFSGKVLVSDEVPPESLTLTAEGKGSQGFGKGVGEAGAIPTPAAFVSAVENALGHLGIEIMESPLSPNRIFELVQPKRT